VSRKNVIVQKAQIITSQIADVLIFQTGVLGFLPQGLCRSGTNAIENLPPNIFGCCFAL
jgi:hypothetical protein